MGWLPRRRNGRPGTLRTGDSADLAHLTEFVRTRTGIEAFLEPRTTVTDTTVVLVAGTGEWTRRRIAGHSAAQSFARKHAIPLYDVAVVGYPQRMRQWIQQQKASAPSRPQAER